MNSLLEMKLKTSRYCSLPCNPDVKVVQLLQETKSEKVQTSVQCPTIANKMTNHKLYVIPGCLQVMSEHAQQQQAHCLRRCQYLLMCQSSQRQTDDSLTLMMLPWP